MNHNHPQETCPTDPTYPDAANVPCENTAKHGENDDAGHIGHVGHIPGTSALLCGLFGDEVPFIPSTTDITPGMDDEADDTTETSIDCGFCGALDLADDGLGLRCVACGNLAWLDADAALIRAECDDHDIEVVDPGDVPVCNTCGALCDTQRLDDAWRCSQCDSDAESRRKRTRRILHDVRRIRLRDGVADAETDTLTDAAARLIPESRIPDPVRRGAFYFSGQLRELNYGKSPQRD